MELSDNIPFRRRYQGLFKRRGQFTMANVLDLVAEVFGDRPAVLLEDDLHYPCLSGRRLSYRQLLEFVNRLGHCLREQGVSRGDRVAIYTRNLLELPLASYAVMKLGAVAVPLNHQLKKGEVDFILEDAQVKLLVTDRATFFHDYRSVDDLPGSIPAAFLDDQGEAPEGAVCLRTRMAAASAELAPAELQPDDLAGIFYTSGTTGFPKGAKMTSKNLVTNNVRTPAAMVGLAPREVARVGMMVQPLSHIMGYALFLSNLIMGQPFVVHEKFHPVRALDAIERHQVNTFIGVPAMYTMMLEAGAEQRNLKSVWLWISGSDEMPAEVRKKFQALGGLTLLNKERPALFVEGYGQAETSPVSTICFHSSFSNWEPGCIGWKLPGVFLKVVDPEGRPVPSGEVGELLVKGDHVMPGYWKSRDGAEEKIFTADGWFHTGDMVRQGKYREYYLVDRKKDVIKHGGYSVFSKEVEEKISAHPAVHEVALVGIRDEKKGQVPIAFAVLRPGSKLTADEFLAWCRSHLADYKVPREVIFLDEMPRGITLKIDKKVLRSRYLRDRQG